MTPLTPPGHAGRGSAPPRELVGRAAELAVVQAFLAGISDGPRGLVIEGDAGIGKTTIWLEGVRQAERAGARVLVARPAERERQLSFAALGDALRGVMPEVEGALPEPQRAALDAALLLRRSDVSADPRATATGLVTTLMTLAAERPVVLAIDDVQWLDRASQRAIAFAVRRLPKRSGVLVARRPMGGTETLDLDAMGSASVARLVVRAMPDEALRRLVALESPGLAPPAVARVVATSGGNPFHAIEIARALRDVGFDPGRPLPIPPSLDTLVRERLDRLSGPARAAATAVAVSFRPTRAVVAAALGEAVDLDAALLEAEEADVIAWEEDRLRLRHPLLGAALDAALTTGRRRALHRRLADAADAPEERAHHLVGSSVAPDEVAARSIERGAEVAERRGAVDAAAELYLAAAARTLEDDSDARARRTLRAARAFWSAADLPQARRLATRAIAGSADPRLRARAHALQASIATYAGSIAERLAAHEAALAAAAGDPGLRAEILSVGARLTVDPWQALEEAREAEQLLRATGDRGRLAQALMTQVMASAVLGLGAPSELVEEVRALEAASPRRAMDPLLWFHWLDDVDGTRARFQRQVALARDDGDDFAVAELAEVVAMAEFRAGHWDLAEQLLEDACEKLGQLGQQGPILASFADRSVVDAHRGRVERARQALRTLLDGDARLDPFWAAVCLSALGTVDFVAGDLLAADQAWTAMRDRAVSVGWTEFLEDRSEPDHVEAVLALGDVDRARALLAHLEWRGRTIPRPWIDATLPRARALLLAVDGRLDDAIASLEAAPLVDGLPFERARLLLVQGGLERRANRKLAARRSLEAALAIVDDLRSPPWIQRTRDQIDRLGLRHRDRHELTAMERRIAELAATGLTNRQVAAAAFVSPKTVEAGLARAYGKLGIRSRAELGARMAGRPDALDPET